MSERGAASGGWARRLSMAVLLGAGCLLLATLGFFFFRDNFSTHYPMKVVSAGAWRAGAIPWWNPTDGGGQPMAGNPNALTFYPDNILYLFLPPHVAFNLHFLLHLLLGWVAMRALIRESIGAPASSRLARQHPAAEDEVRQDAAQPAAWKAALPNVAALADIDGATFGAWLWVLSGAAVSALAFYNLVTAIALIPFALWAARSRSPLIYGAAFGLLILGTEPVTVVATALAVAIVSYGKVDRTGVAGAQPWAPTSEKAIEPVGAHSCAPATPAAKENEEVVCADNANHTNGTNPLASSWTGRDPSPGASRHPLPVGEGRSRESLLPVGEGARRADEGRCVRFALDAPGDSLPDNHVGAHNSPVEAFVTFAKRAAIAIVVAAVIALPQIIAYGEIAKEVERARGYSAQTVLNASFDPRRILELLVGPFLHLDAPHLFPSLLIGIIAIPALARRSRWTVVAAVSLFFALGRFNPLMRLVIEAVPSLRFARYPEKFALPLCAALVVLAAMFYAGTARKTLWAVVTFVPLVAWAWVTVPIDWWSPYALAPHETERIVYTASSPEGQTMDRAAYRNLARQLTPAFGATAGYRYVLNRSGDGMHSTLSRIVAERWATTHNRHYAAIALELPMAMLMPRALGVASINDAVRALESPSFDERQVAVAPRVFNGFVSDPRARVTSYRELADGIEIGVAAPGDALLFVNQSYFTAWDTGGSLRTVPLDIDRLGVVVRAGTKLVTLRFGRHRTVVLAAWVISSAVLLAALLALRIEKRDRGAGQVEGPADEDRAG